MQQIIDELTQTGLEEAATFIHEQQTQEGKSYFGRPAVIYLQGYNDSMSYFEPI
jgi:hypothetical protein